MKTLARLLALLLLLHLSAPGASTLASYTFDDPAQGEEFRELIAQMRCLVCQNESLAGSNADLAQDLRREIYEMMLAGSSKQQIIDFMVARYGDFVLYNPPLKPSTYPLWFGPLILLLIAALVLLRVLLRKKTAPETALSAGDEQRLKDLLHRDPEIQIPQQQDAEK